MYNKNDRWMEDIEITDMDLVTIFAVLLFMCIGIISFVCLVLYLIFG